jgi:hypothetical protein
MTKREARRWVRGFWADRMRSGDIPDLPEDYEEVITEVWADECLRLAQRIDPS